MTDATHTLARNTFPQGATTMPMQRLAWLFPILILAMVGAMLAWNAHVRYREFEIHQRRLMESSVNGTAAEIGVFIGELRRSVHLFADMQRALLDRLAAEPDDPRVLEELTAAVRNHFPEAFAFTLADNTGEPLLDDFDGLVGDICVNDMRSFAKQREHSNVYIHPNPVAYHFDIMVDRGHHNGSAGIFFVSFTTDILARTLTHGEAPGHKLLLLKQDIPGLIEVASDGVRIKLQREFKLNTREMQRIGYSRPVGGTSWDLADLPAADLYADMRGNIQREAGLILLAFLAVNGSMLWLLLRSQAKRRRIEHLYHHDAVTGLPNRHLFLERFAQMTAASEIGAAFALLLIDIGQFRRLKGTFFEHRADDALTKSAAERIEASLSRTGIVARIIARIGDSDYAVLLQEHDPERIESIANHVLAALNKPFGADNDIVLHNSRLGSAVYPLDGADIDMLIRHAGAQIYAARQQDRNGRAPRTVPGT